MSEFKTEKEFLAWATKSGSGDKPHPQRKASDDIAGLMKAIAPVVGDYVAKMIKPLANRISELENRPTLKYTGVFEIGRTYEPGNVATDRGAMWHCNSQTRQRPGDGGSDWTLCVKSGDRK